MKDTKKQPLKLKLRLRKKKHIRKIIFGSKKIPRLCIFRSIANIGVQAINDYQSITILSLSTLSKNVKYLIYNKTKCQQSNIIGKYFGKMLYRKGIKKLSIDRNGYKYSGRIKYLIDGIKFIGLYT